MDILIEIIAEFFTVLFGTDVYVFLLKRGYIEYWLIDKQPAVHCRISKKGLNKCKKIKI